jgi:Spy/CpxP family protein refolding chaperone
LLLLSLLTMVPPARAATPDAPPLTESQYQQIRDLVRLAQSELAALDGRIAARRAELTELYRSYHLDERQSEKLLAEVNEIQRKTLEVHQRVQVRLRRIVSEAQFQRLRQRLERVLAAPPSSSPSTPPRGARP